MAANNETPSSSSEGIINKVKDLVYSAIKKIAKPIKNAVNKILDMVESSITGEPPKSETSITPASPATPSTPAPAPSAPTETTAIAPEIPTPEPETPAHDTATEVVAQTETDEEIPVQQKVTLVDGKLSDAAKKTIKENLQGMANPPTKEDIKQALVGIIQNTVSNTQKKVSIPTIGISENGLTAEESAEATLETLLEIPEFTKQLDEILIYINDPAHKATFEAAFSAVTPNTDKLHN